MVQKLKLILPLRSGEGTCKSTCCFFIHVFMDEFIFTCIYNHFTLRPIVDFYWQFFFKCLLYCAVIFFINVSNQTLFKTFFWWIYPKWISVWYFVSACRRFDYPQPTFQKLMKENCMEPFFVFQVSFTFVVNGSSSYFFLSIGYYCSKYCVSSICRFSVWVFGAWMSSGITVCSHCSCFSRSSQQWQKPGWRH